MGADARLFELASSTLRVVVDVARGGQLIHIGRVAGPNVLFHEDWDTPKPSSPSSGYGSESLDWLSHYRGGWQVMFPNAGMDCTVDGVPMPLHGEVSVTRPEVRGMGPSWLVLESPTGRRLRLRRRIELDARRPILHIDEQALNDADRPLAVAWGQHPAFQAAAGSRIDLPAGAARSDEAFDHADADLEPGTAGEWPLLPGRDGSSVDLSIVPHGPVERVCYLPDRPEHWAALRDLTSGQGVAMAWDGAVFPHLWLWQQLGGDRFPFFGRARIVALEPVSCWPADGLAAALERSQALTIQSGTSVSAWTTLALFEASSKPVVGMDQAGLITFAK